MTAPIRIRNSEVSCFRDCRRKWLNQYVLNLTNEGDRLSREPGKNDIGTYVHSFLECHYGGKVCSVAGFQDEIDEARSPFATEWSAALNLAYTMYQGYGPWCDEEGHDQSEDTIATERTLEWEIMPGVFLTGQIDRTVWDTQWDLYIIEDYKTVDSLVKGPQFQVDTQLLTYVLLANKNGYPCSDARHTMLRRVKRSAKAKPPFYGRAEVTFNEDQLAAHERALRVTVGEMLAIRAVAESGNNDVCYPNPTKDCSWKCPFLGICAAHDDGSDITGLRAELFTVREAEEAA